MEAGPALFKAIKTNPLIQRFDIEDNHLDLKIAEGLETRLYEHRI